MSFKDYLAEANNNLGATDLVKKIGMTRMRSMTKHPWYQHYIRDYTGLKPVAYLHNKGNLNHKVMASADGRTMVEFNFWNYKVSNAHLYRWDGQSRTLSGNKMWEHKKSYREDE